MVSGKDCFSSPEKRFDFLIIRSPRIISLNRNSIGERLIFTTVFTTKQNSTEFNEFNLQRINSPQIMARTASDLSGRRSTAQNC